MINDSFSNSNVFFSNKPSVKLSLLIFWSNYTRLVSYWSVPKLELSGDRAVPTDNVIFNNLIHVTNSWSRLEDWSKTICWNKVFSLFWPKLVCNFLKRARGISASAEIVKNSYIWFILFKGKF
jgi:hypothetical protein